MTTTIFGHVGRTFPPPRDLVTPVTIQHMLEAWRFFSEHGRDAEEAIYQARIAARAHGGLEWLGMPGRDGLNVAVARLWLLKRNRLGANVAMRLALRLDIEESRG